MKRVLGFYKINNSIVFLSKVKVMYVYVFFWRKRSKKVKGYNVL